MIRILTIGMVVALLVGAGPTTICNVPVFRYALERWRPDNYEMIVIHVDPLTAADKDLLDSFDRQAEGKCNLAVSVVDWNTVSAERKEKIQAIYKISQFPWVIVRYPLHVETDGPAYQGPLHADALRHLLASPARTELARRLLQGESAVWVLLESGNRQKDDEVEVNLKTWLGKLEQTLKLPELTSSVKDKLLRDDIPLKLSFSIIRVSRADAAETHFVHILRHMEKDLSSRTEPMVIPVFGRGLALYSIIGNGITEENVTEAAAFLASACSCEVKQLNPGVDLLMTAAWDGPAPSPLVQPRSAETREEPMPVKIPQPSAKKVQAEPRNAERDLSRQGGPQVAENDIPAQPVSRPDSQPAPQKMTESTKPPTSAETNADATESEESASFLRLGNPLLASGVCLLLGALAIVYYARYRGLTANRPQ